MVWPRPINVLSSVFRSATFSFDRCQSFCVALFVNYRLYLRFLCFLVLSQRSDRRRTRSPY